MSDEGIGMAGWLLADLVLVLALVFLTFTPAALSGEPDAAVIVDIGCETEAFDGQTNVRCTPDVGGGEAQFYAWTAERGEPAAGGASTFVASFAGAGAVRLTVSNAGGEHSAAFPILPPPVPPPITSPVILDIGCEIERSNGQTDVRCIPEIGGGTPSSYEWTAVHDWARSHERGTDFSASFVESGAVTLTVSNDGGEHRAAFPVLPPRTAVVVSAPECSDVQTDFRFAQIVLSGAALGAVNWDDIASSKVREDVIKSAELDDIDDGALDCCAEAFLREKLNEGLRIALVETFAHEPDGKHVALARDVNDAFSKGLRDADIDILRDPPAAGRWKWFGDYLARGLPSREVRLNLYFVKPFDDEDCR